MDDCSEIYIACVVKAVHDLDRQARISAQLACTVHYTNYINNKLVGNDLDTRYMEVSIC